MFFFLKIFNLDSEANAALSCLAEYKWFVGLVVLYLLYNLSFAKDLLNNAVQMWWPWQWANNGLHSLRKKEKRAQHQFHLLIKVKAILDVKMRIS